MRLDSTVAQNAKILSNSMIDFRDPKTSFIAATTPELLRSTFVFRMCSWDWLVRHNKKIMEICRNILGRTLFQKLMKATIYGHFVAGEDREKIMPLVRRYRKYGVKSILDYSVEKDIPESEAVKKFKEALEVIDTPKAMEAAASKQFQPSLQFADRSKHVFSARTYFYESEAQCDENMRTFMRCIDAATQMAPTEGFSAIKLTALGRPQFLLQLSDFLVEMERMFYLLVNAERPSQPSPQQPMSVSIDIESFRKQLERLGVEISHDTTVNWFTLIDHSSDGVVDLLDWLHFKHFEHDLATIFKIKNKKTGRMEQLVSTLKPEGIEQMRNMIGRIDELAQYAKSRGVRLMIDAEHSYFQPAIRRLTMEMMRRFNKDQAVVFNTYQCYLRSALEQLTMDLKMSEVQNFYFGAKLVRGAYMEQERARAAELGYPDPINPTYEATSKMYEDCLEECFGVIQHRPKGTVSVMVATHNEDSVRFALQKMREYGIQPEHRLICFGQLLGMCDQVSFPLGQAGYSVYKYVPYGPVEEVLPYLSRRASENQSILSNIIVERKLRAKELRRRLFSGQLFCRP